jgi:hypothetical protein
MEVTSTLRNTPLPAAMAKFKQILPNQRWGPKRRLHCAIDFSVKSMNLQAATKPRFGRTGRSPKRTS